MNFKHTAFSSEVGTGSREKNASTECVTSSKAIAVTAAIAAAIVLMQSPAEARRYKQQPARHQVAAFSPVSGGILGAGNQYAHLTEGEAARPVARGARRGRQSSAGTAPDMSRTARASHASVAPTAGLGSSSLVATARAYIGTNPTGMSALWCARFMNLVLEKSGRRGTGSNMAKSFASYGRRIAGPQVGAIAVMSRGRGGGHVGIVSGIDKSGNPIIISGNHNRKVAESVYPRGRIYAYVLP
ncbi:MAG: TIGR02594 family protein [Pseudomonadota bacterium]